MSTTRERFDLKFLGEDDTSVFFRAADPATMFALQFTLSRQMMDLIAAREPMQKIHQTPFPGHQQCHEPNTVSPALAFLRDLVEQNLIDIEGVSSVPIGFSPRMLYFGVGDPIPILKLHEQSYEGILRLRKIIGRRPPDDFNALVSSDGFLFIISRQPTFVDLVPLDPLQFANVYATVLCDSLDFEDLPASVLAEHQAAASAMFHALGNLYLANDNKIAKLPHPCVYREDEGEVIENALRILRAHAACGPGLGLDPAPTRLVRLPSAEASGVR